MKKSVLVLMTLFTLLPGAQLMAQAPPVAVTPTNDAAAPPPDVDQFLATLSGDQAQAPSELAPASLFRDGNCTSNSQCPTGQLCCNLCGNPPDDGSSCLFCVQPVRKRCPLVV